MGVPFLSQSVPIGTHFEMGTYKFCFVYFIYFFIYHCDILNVCNCQQYLLKAIEWYLICIVLKIVPMKYIIYTLFLYFFDSYEYCYYYLHLDYSLCTTHQHYRNADSNHKNTLLLSVTQCFLYTTQPNQPSHKHPFFDFLL